MKMKNIEWRHVTWYSQLFAIVLFLDVFGLGFWLGIQDEGVGVAAQIQAMRTSSMQMHATPQPVAQPTITSVNYTCTSGKKIEAVFMGNTVNLSLSDGRSENLLQSISADGGRYTNSDESFVFWSKGNGAFITEGTKTTFANCEGASPTPAK
jgi:membrane-bound inhibitor of C-type lysozyme